MAFILLIAHLTTNAGTVNFSNFESGLEVQSDGEPIMGGFVAVGTTSNPDSYSDPDLLESSFVQFGESTSFGGASAFNLGGFFSGVAIGDGGSSEFSGKTIYIIGGEGQSISDSESLFLIDTGAKFAADSPIFAANVDLDSGTILLGETTGEPSISGASGAFQTQNVQGFTINDQNFEILENSDEGKVVGTINGYDEIQFTILNNYDSNNDGKPAFIFTGSDLILNDPKDIDYETANTVNLNFNGSLSSGESDEASILITIIDDTSEDIDDDGLNQDQEASIGTSDLLKDTDNDGFDDGVEIAIGTDPTDKSSNPSLNEARELIRELEEKNNNLANSLREKDSSISSLEDSLAIKTQEVTSLNESITQKDSEINNLNTQVSSLNDSIIQKDSSIASLEDSLAIKTQEVTSLNESITQKDSEINNLNTQVSSLNDSIIQKDSSIASLEDSLAIKTQEVTSLNESVTQKDSEINNLNTQVSSLNDSIIQKDSSISSLEDSLAIKTQEVTSLNESVTQKDSEINNLNTQVSSLNDSIIQKDNSISSLNEQINTARTLITDKETKIVELNNQIDTLSSTAQNAENQSTVITSLNSTIDSKNKELDDLNLMYQSKCTEVATLNDEIDLLNESIIDKIIEIGKLCERPSLDEIQEGRIGSVVLTPNIGENTITIDLAIEESLDLIEWKPINQKISTTLQLDKSKKFYRFSAE